MNPTLSSAYSPKDYLDELDRRYVSLSVRDKRINLVRNFPSECVLRGKEKPHFLDLGCGVDNRENYHALEPSNRFTPKMCKAAIAAGWSVTGLDYADMQPRPRDWEFVQGDITQAHTLDIKPFSMDFIHSTLLFTLTHTNDISPSLELPKSGFKPYSTGGDLERLVESNEYMYLLRRIFWKVYEVLKMNGIFILNDREIFYKTPQGLLVYDTVNCGRIIQLDGTITELDGESPKGKAFYNPDLRSHQRGIPGCSSLWSLMERWHDGSTEGLDEYPLGRHPSEISYTSPLGYSNTN